MNTKPQNRTVLGVIGGSGLYQMDALEDARWERVPGPWGAPSDDLLTGRIAGVDCVFLPRHGRGHRLTPGAVNYRDNIDALKRVGVTDIISVSAYGSLKKTLTPNTFVMMNQFINLTRTHENNYFRPGLVAHVGMGHPVCPRLGDALAEAAAQTGIPHQRGGTYVTIEGPQFSSYAESVLYRSWGCDVIGMTNATEAKLAREAELPYATAAMVTDYDCWHPDHDHVEVASVIRVLNENADKAREMVKALAPLLGPERTPSPLGIETTLDTAIITPPEARDPELVAKLDAVAGRMLGAGRG